MRCPRCPGVLERASLRELGLTLAVHRCSSCGGLWLGQERLAEIEETFDRKLLELRRIPSEEDQRAALQCPACDFGVVMEKVVSPRDARVIMDVCPKCRHVWLDPGEREAIEQEDLIAVVRDTFFPSRRT